VKTIETFEQDSIETPAFIYDEARITAAAARVCEVASAAGCSVLYTLKPFALADGLRLLVGQVAGFAASSVFEAELAHAILEGRGTVHLTSPGLREEDLAAVREFCDYVSFNSLSQWARLRPLLGASGRCGIRVNPQLSFVTDSRYDPCRLGSKLGVPLNDLVRALESTPDLVSGLDGLHFHSNCDCGDFSQLYGTMVRIQKALGSQMLGTMRWLNMGGGYLFTATTQNLDGLREAVELVRQSYGIEVFLEPGASLVRDAGFLVSTVVDMFASDGQTIAVLDTTVNHMPEVFEYQFEPDVLGHSDDGRFEYTLAGGSCLAGDVFGQYAFERPLTVGSRVVFTNVGAYSLVKAHMFNGINLPTVYARTPSAQFVLKKTYTYQDFASRCGMSHA
jgi:carboxynorspermidine decarboxylase